MFKLAIAATLIAAGTTAVVVYKSDSSATAAVIDAPTITLAKVAPERPKQAPRAPAILPKLQLEEDPPLPPGAIMAPPPDVVPSIDAKTYRRLKLDVGPSRGPNHAPVTIVMFTDLQCKYCGISHGTLDQLFDEYPTKLRLVIKQMPVHKTAELAAEAALAAEAQGKFWELDELMIANHEDLSKDAILGLAKQGGLDVARLRSDLDHHSYRAALDADKAAANELEIRATPSFIINGRKVVGALPIEDIRATIEASLLDDKKN